MSTPVSAFITVTLGFTLPPLFADRQREILDAMAREVNKEVYELFFSYASKILAHIFLLSKPGRTTAALNFIVELLSGATGPHENLNISAQTAVRGQTIDVISEIVMKMGDDDPSATQLVSLSMSLPFRSDEVVAGEAVVAETSTSSGEQTLRLPQPGRCCQGILAATYAWCCFPAE